MYYNLKKIDSQTPQNQSTQTNEENNDGIKTNETTPELAMMGENQTETNMTNHAAT